MCKLLGVSSSGYYAWVQRRPSRRAETDATLIAEIRAAHGASRGVYGAPRVHAELTAKGIQVSRKRIARLMSRAGLAGVCRRKFVVTTVKGDNCQVYKSALDLSDISDAMNDQTADRWSLGMWPTSSPAVSGVLRTPCLDRGRCADGLAWTASMRRSSATVR